MPTVFARVELRGDPTWENYNQLHALMKGKHWYQHLPGYPDKPMPHAMYQANFANEPDLLAVADALRKDIELNVWTKAIVLLIKEAHWAQSTG
jgi:hypothetical protein